MVRIGRTHPLYSKLVRREKKRPQRFVATKTYVDGIHFASKLEAGVWVMLKQRQDMGEISELKYIDSVTLPVPKCRFCGSSGGSLVYKVDFSAVENGEKFYVEAKGQEAVSYRRRKNLWKRFGPGRLEIWKGSGRRPRLDEIVPKGTKL